MVIISEDDTVYILIKLVKEVNDPTAIDGKSGVERPYLDGFNPNDHFKIAWDELGAYTIEEYEAEKARKEKARRERIEREERERQKRIAEEEKRLKEKRKLVEQTIDKMKDYKIKTPSFPKMPDIRMDSGLSSLNLYMDSIDVYFDTLDSSLRSISKDLSGISKIIGIDLNNANIKSSSSIFDMLKL